MARSSDRHSRKSVIIQWRFGTSSSKRSKGAISTDKRFSDDLMKLALDKGQRGMDYRGTVLTERIQEVITRSYGRAWTFALNNLLGKNSSRSPTKFTFRQYDDGTSNLSNRGRGRYIIDEDLRTGTSVRLYTQPVRQIDRAIEWAPLTWKHIRRKTGRVSKGTSYSKEYWKWRGDLTTEMKQLGRSAVKGLGTPEVKLRRINKAVQAKNKDFAHTHTLSIRLMPNISRGSLPGVATGDVTKENLNMSFERALGFSDHSLAKLHGPYSHSGLVHRPFFQPVFTYWTLFHIPNDLAKAMTQAINRVNPKKVAS